MSLLPEYEKTWEVVERSQDGKTTTSTLVDPQSNETQSSLRLDNSNDEIQVEKTATPAQPVDISVQQIGTTPVLNTDADLEDVEDEVAPLSMQKIMDVTEMGTRNGDSIITRSRRFRKPKQKKEKFHSYIALCRRKLNDVGMIVSIDLEVNSPILRRAFAEVLKNVERINLDADPIVIPKPFEVLWYRWDKMMEYYEKMKGKPGEKELAKIVEFIEANLEDIRKEYKKNVTYGKITSAIAWTIFQPGEIICTNKKSSSPTQCFEVRDCKTVPGGLEIKCSTCQFNGRAFGYSKQLILITLPTNAGSYPITDLNVYPLKYMSDADDMKKRLIERGHRYAQIVRRAHLNYNGVIWTQDLLMGGIIQLTIAGRVMIDYKMFTRQVPASAVRLDKDPAIEIEEDSETGYCSKDCKVCKREKGLLGKNEAHERDTVDDTEALLCPGFVRGFALTDKVWAEFQIDKLTDITWNDQAYTRLEMNAEFKEVISALVNSHANHGKSVSEFDDIIAGKGLGLVFLLQGPPGLGKTLTAESVAEQCHRPLYSVTSGELGTTVQDMEGALQRAFRIAKEWEAILLLDEADVFLSKRSSDNLEKNAFVSVFLRLLEYYQGILFLTTNRAEEFDSAFISRIHLIIDYDPLDDVRRSRIWRNLAGRISKDNSLGDEGFKVLGQELDINGREIKNLLRTASSLAKQKEEPLSLDKIRQVAKLSRKFRRDEDVTQTPPEIISRLT